MKIIKTTNKNDYNEIFIIEIEKDGKKIEDVKCILHREKSAIDFKWNDWELYLIGRLSGNYEEMLPVFKVFEEGIKLLNKFYGGEL